LVHKNAEGGEWFISINKVNDVSLPDSNVFVVWMYEIVRNVTPSQYYGTKGKLLSCCPNKDKTTLGLVF
jgi:hypothetical protein